MMRYITCLLVTLCITTSTLCAAAQSGQQPSTSEKQQVSKQGTQNPEAYELYLRGRYQWNQVTQEGLTNSIEYYKKAIAVDPNFALAYAGIANSYILLANWGFTPPTTAFEHAKEAANRAIKDAQELLDSIRQCRESPFRFSNLWGLNRSRSIQTSLQDQTLPTLVCHRYIGGV